MKAGLFKSFYLPGKILQNQTLNYFIFIPTSYNSQNFNSMKACKSNFNQFKDEIVNLSKNSEKYLNGTCS